jgi:hypothetical protein
MEESLPARRPVLRAEAGGGAPRAVATDSAAPIEDLARDVGLNVDRDRDPGEEGPPDVDRRDGVFERIGHHPAGGLVHGVDPC